jgi:hypothetical protein
MSSSNCTAINSHQIVGALVAFVEEKTRKDAACDLEKPSCPEPRPRAARAVDNIDIARPFDEIYDTLHGHAGPIGRLTSLAVEY